MLPWLNKNEFFALLHRSAVVLDTLHFGGGNTSFDAFTVGTPVVTQPGQFFRGRGTAAKYRQMQVDGLTADTEAAYVDRALAIANDPDIRLKYSRAIRENYPKLLRPQGLLAEYEAWIASLVAESPLRQ